MEEDRTLVCLVKSQVPVSTRPPSRFTAMFSARRIAFSVLLCAPALRCLAGTANGFRGASFVFRFMVISRSG
jgi:hypothetical protein